MLRTPAGTPGSMVAIAASVLLAVPLSMVCPNVALAAQAPPPPPMGVWTGKGQLGFLSSQGNTEATSANAALAMQFLDGPWKHALNIGYLYGKSSGVVAAERWDAQWQTNYNLTRRLFAFGLLDYQHDMFSGFQYQGSGTVGIGYQLIDSASTKLSVQLGAGDREQRPEDLVKVGGVVVGRVPLPSNNNVIATGGLNYTQQLTDTTSLSDTALLEAGSDNTMITNTLALAVKVSNKMAVSLGYALQENTQPPDGLKKLNSTETVNLVYSF